MLNVTHWACPSSSAREMRVTLRLAANRSERPAARGLGRSQLRRLRQRHTVSNVSKALVRSRPQARPRPRLAQAWHTRRAPPRRAAQQWRRRWPHRRGWRRGARGERGRWRRQSTRLMRQAEFDGDLISRRLGRFGRFALLLLVWKLGQHAEATLYYLRGTTG